VALELLALAMAQWRGTMSPAEVAAKVDAFNRLPAPSRAHSAVKATSRRWPTP